MKRKTERNLRRQTIEEQIRELTQEVEDHELRLQKEDDPQRREEIQGSLDGVRDEISRLNSLLLGDGLRTLKEGTMAKSTNVIWCIDIDPESSSISIKAWADSLVQTGQLLQARLGIHDGLRWRELFDAIDIVDGDPAQKEEWLKVRQLLRTARSVTVRGRSKQCLL